MFHSFLIFVGYETTTEGCTIKRANLSVKLRYPKTLLPKGSMTLLCVTNAVQGLNMKGSSSAKLPVGQGEWDDIIKTENASAALATSLFSGRATPNASKQQTSQFRVSFQTREVLIKIVHITGFFLQTLLTTVIRVCKIRFVFLMQEIKCANSFDQLEMYCLWTDARTASARQK